MRTNKVLILLRGLPGSGKSTLANFLFTRMSNCVAISADDYFISESGKYVFDMDKIGDAHSSCQNKTYEAMKASTEVIVIHNTMTTTKEMSTYFKLATEWGYTVESLIVENRHGATNVHNVPEQTLVKMKERFNVKLI